MSHRSPQPTCTTVSTGCYITLECCVVKHYLLFKCYWLEMWLTLHAVLGILCLLFSFETLQWQPHRTKTLPCHQSWLPRRMMSYSTLLQQITHNQPSHNICCTRHLFAYCFLLCHHSGNLTGPRKPPLHQSSLPCRRMNCLTLLSRSHISHLSRK